jgi:PadR family transcriptional regulator PadR
MKVNKELLKGSTVVLILNMLNKKPMYGYEIIKIIDQSSQGVFSLNEGTIYPILHTLEHEGMLESYWGEGNGERKRKFYNITTKGQEQLQQKSEEWVAFRTAIDRVLGSTL